MKSRYAFLIGGIILGLILGFTYHNFKVDQCEVRIDNQNEDYIDYRAIMECGEMVELFYWNLFFKGLISTIIVGALFFGIGWGKERLE